MLSVDIENLNDAQRVMDKFILEWLYVGVVDDQMWLVKPF